MRPVMLCPVGVCPVLSGSDCEAEDDDAEEYDELDHREEGQFWVTRDEGVECAEDACDEDDEEIKPVKSEPVISLFALGTLCRYLK